MDRTEILETANNAVSSDREEEYGPPSKNFGDCALLWTAYLRGKYAGIVGVDLSAEDIAHMNTLQKIARTFSGAAGADTYVDMAGYSALAGEINEPSEDGALPFVPNRSA